MRALVPLLAVACATPGPDATPADALPPSTVLTATAVVEGAQFELVIEGSPPGTVHYVFASLAGPGPGPCAPGGALCLGIRAPVQLGTARADASGRATLRRVFPALGAPQVAFQAATLAGGGIASNVVSRVVNDGDLDGVAASGDCDDADPGVTEPCCTHWVATYDLTGSTFTIDTSLADFTITLEEPYDDDLTMGPGDLTLRFPDAGGAPGNGEVVMTRYALDQDFTTGVAGIASVRTVLSNLGEDDDGVAFGTLAGTSLTWSPNTIDPVCVNGTITCTGFLCGTLGTPPASSPTVFSNDCAARPVGTFTFSPDLSAFDAAGVILSQTSDQTTTLTLQGTRTSLALETDTVPCP